ncbi:TolC family protein [Salinibius halmophilus]|uniref:TolC family protein n=1 Tax=Salinibius halmophilus TaxID=1853216 RepID=UPI000E674207|nr:TolC family protein [Salinibius halmophilus]
MKSLTKAVVIASSLMATQAFAADSVETLYQVAKANDPSIQAAVNGKEEAVQLKRQALGALLPSANASLSYGTATSTQTVSQPKVLLVNGVNTSGNPDSGAVATLETASTEEISVGLGDRAQLTGSISVQQNVFNMQAIKGYAITDLYTERAQFGATAAEQDLMLSVAEATIALMKARSGVELAQRQEEAVSRQLEQVEAKYQEGLVARTEVENARASYEEARLGVILQGNMLKSTQRQLELIVGQQVDAAVINPALAERLAVGNLEQWLNAAEQSPAMRNQAVSVQLAESQADIARYAYYPTVGASISYSRGAQFADWVQDGEIDDQGSVNLGVSVNIPIFNGFRTSADIVNKQIQAENAAASFEQGLRQVKNGVTALYEQLQSDLTNISVREQLVRSRQSAAQATEAGYEVGTATIVEVIGAQSNLFAAERDLTNARYDLLLNSLKLKEAAGTLSMDDLASLN